MGHRHPTTPDEAMVTQMVRSAKGDYDRALSIYALALGVFSMTIVLTTQATGWRLGAAACFLLPVTCGLLLLVHERFVSAVHLLRRARYYEQTARELKAIRAGVCPGCGAEGPVTRH
jgi:hypothetical protein